MCNIPKIYVRMYDIYNNLPRTGFANKEVKLAEYISPITYVAAIVSNTIKNLDL